MKPLPSRAFADRARVLLLLATLEEIDRAIGANVVPLREASAG